MQQTINLMKKSTELVAVHVNELYEGWQLGTLAFATELASDSPREAQVNAKAAKFFAELGTEVVESALRRLEKQ
jgi:hypothetical protein